MKRTVPSFGATFASALAVALLAASAFPAENPRWPNGLPEDPEFFPLAVWVQVPGNAERYKAIGVNTYVGLWRPPTDEQIDALERAGIHLICHQSEATLKYKDHKVIAGWMHGDEPDNAQARQGGGGWDPPIAPARIVKDYEKIKATDSTRPVLLNLGQGVAWDNWYGRGVRTNHPEDYPQYIKGCDIASFDIYPVTHDHPEVAGKLSLVGDGVRRLGEWTGGRKPVWACIETTRIGNEKVMPTPQQVRAEVWMAITHGATGIIYFCHEFKPQTIEAGLLAHQEMADGVKAINAEVLGLAPMINAPAAGGALNVRTSVDGTSVATLYKQHGRHTYIFAVSRSDKPLRASFSPRGSARPGMVEVVGENRSIKSSAGRFDDDFAAYGVHIYRLSR